MSDLKLDPITGDLALENGDLVLISGRDEITQLLSQRLRLFLGEWFLDTDSGVDYYGSILGKRRDPAVIDGLLKQEILDTPGILGLEEFSLDLDTATRTLTLDFKARSSDGVIEFSEEIP